MGQWNRQGRIVADFVSGPDRIRLVVYPDGRWGILRNGVPVSARGPDQAAEGITHLRAITHDRAADWRQYLAGLGLSEAAVKTHRGNAKTIFHEAVRRKLVPENPFEHLRSGPTASAEDHYVTPTEAAAVIDALPDAEWKLLFGLSRHAGLRVPSESHLLTWADVDWARGRLNVRSPKTERHAGHERRTVPVTPPLMKLLQDRFDTAAEGEQRLVTMRGAGHVRRTVEAAIKRAGVKPWRKLFQACRSSCEKQWAMTYPEYAVSKWIGHSITVSGRHYANDVPDELFDRATMVAERRGPNGVLEVAQNAAQQAAESPRTRPQTKDPAEAGSSHIVATTRILPQAVAGHVLGGGGNRTPVPR